MERTTQIVTTSDEVAISVDCYRNGAQERALVICPGFFASKETATFRRMAQALATTRDVVTMDFRGHGRSSGSYTFSAKEGADLEAVLQWVQPRYAKIDIMGFSLGAAIAITTIARQSQGIDRVIAVSGPSSFEEIEFKFWTPEAMRIGILEFESGAGCRPGSVFLKKERPVEAIGSLRLPILLIHGTNDVIISHHHSHRLYAAAQEPKRLTILEGGSHAEALYRDDPRTFLGLVESWLTHPSPSTSH